MPRIRRSNRWAERLACAASALLVAACARRPPEFATAERWPESRREPDAVTVDPLPAPVQGARRASTTDTSVALVPPIPVEVALGTVRSFFEAVAHEDTNALGGLFLPIATWTNPSAASRSPSSAIGTWRERFRRLDYRQLGDSAAFHERDADVYTVDDLDAPLPGRPSRPPEMVAGDVLVRSRVATVRVGADRLFGDEITFVLRPERDRYRIALLVEDFQLPLTA